MGQTECHERERSIRKKAIAELMEVLGKRELCCFFKRRKCDWLTTAGRKSMEQGVYRQKTVIYDHMCSAILSPYMLTPERLHNANSRVEGRGSIWTSKSIADSKARRSGIWVLVI